MKTRMNQPSNSNLTRREFLKVSSLAGGGLLLGVYLSGCDDIATPSATVSPTATALPTTETPPTDTLEPVVTARPNAWFEPSVFLKIGTDNLVTITVHKSEMGQGVRTALPMIIAEELEVDWATVRVEQALADPRYSNQLTGGSTSVSESYTRFRRVGATARDMLISAAALLWKVERDTCYAEAGKVFHQPSGQSLTYGELVETASTLEPPSSQDIVLKDPADFRLIGTRVGRVDNPEIVSGSAVYGLDVKLPGMLYAVIARPPMLGGQLTSFDATNASAVAGVQQVVRMDNAVAVVAENTWAALQGRDALEIVWEDGAHTELNTAGIRETLTALAMEELTAMEGEQSLQAIYEVPYFAHATMEPMNCVADVRPDRCEVWAPTQAPQEAWQLAQRITGLPDEAIQVHVTLIGGGFGRRLRVDYVEEAVLVSQAAGAPIQVVWTREDDIRNDFYHPFTQHLAHARLDQPSLPDVQTFRSRAPLPTGDWRAVTNIAEAFVRESFLDEMAAALGRDPFELRMELEPESLRGVLEVAATQAGWGTSLSEGQGRGIACHATWGDTFVALVAKVSVDEGGHVQVHRVVCAVDCGVVINPDVVEAQMEGGIVFGLTAALKGQGITVENGRVQQSNFHDFPLWRFDEMPVIEVHILPSDRLPQGVGEMSTPPLIPAIANAIFAATGKRVRRIPILPEDILAA